MSESERALDALWRDCLAALCVITLCTMAGAILAMMHMP